MKTNWDTASVNRVTPRLPFEQKIRIDDICKEETHDSVNHPNHYQGENGMEALDVIYAFTKDLDGGEAFCAGNAIKYILRWHKKNGIEDLEKARWYISQLIGFELTKKHTYEEECNAYTE